MVYGFVLRQDLAVIGEAKYRLIHDRIIAGEAKVDHALHMLQKSNKLLRKGYDYIPQLPPRRDLRLYFEDLTRLSMLMSRLDPRQTRLLTDSSTTVFDRKKPGVSIGLSPAELHDLEDLIQQDRFERAAKNTVVAGGLREALLPHKQIGFFGM